MFTFKHDLTRLLQITKCYILILISSVLILIPQLATGTYWDRKPLTYFLSLQIFKVKTVPFQQVQDSRSQLKYVVIYHMLIAILKSYTLLTLNKFIWLPKNTFLCSEFQNTYNNRNKCILLSQAYSFSGHKKHIPIITNLE